jgi:L-lactate dehydrogenase complex protein LldG
LEESLVSEREKILGRIREALKVKAPYPGDHDTCDQPTQSHLPNLQQARKWLPSGGNNAKERLELFARNSTDLKAHFHLVDNWEQIQTLLLQLKAGERWQRVASHSGEMTRKACEALPLPVCWTDSGYDVKELENCDAAITECDALVAQTGSVLLTSRSAGGRALSVLPPHHVVIARRDQIISDLPEAFELLKIRYGKAYPSFISFITGPSRTGDIERILVLGAHGPKKLTIICV